MVTAKFPYGKLLMTRGVNELITKDEAFTQFIHSSLARHLNGDWGDLAEEDKQENEFALTHDLRLFSAYKNGTLPKIWIITEADRSATTILLPEEY